MNVADHIRVHRTGYWHHGIYVGARGVIHFSGTLWHKANASIRRGTLASFAEGADVECVGYARPVSPAETIARAESCLGERDYSVVANNCEHFAVWCKVGRFQSKQVDRYPIVRTFADFKGILVSMERHRRLRQRIGKRYDELEAAERAKTERVEAELEAELRDYKLSLLAGLARIRKLLATRALAAEKLDADRARVEREAQKYLKALRSLRPGDPDVIFMLEKINALLRLY